MVTGKTTALSDRIETVGLSPKEKPMKAIVGYESLRGNTAAKAPRFVVTGGNGPPRAGEAKRARAWGAELGGALRNP
jgi:hypothetical protein